MPRATVPDEVLQAVAENPDCWETVIEMARWRRDLRSGSIEVTFKDGRAQELMPGERRATGEKLERALDPTQQPICPICHFDLRPEEGGNRWHCVFDRGLGHPMGCDQVWTIWELRRRGSFRPRGGP